MTPEQACTQAIEQAGGAAAVSKRTGVSIQAVDQWLRVPPRWCIVVSVMGDCRTSIFQMQPEVFGTPADLARALRKLRRINGQAKCGR